MFPEVVFGLITLYLIQLLTSVRSEEPLEIGALNLQLINKDELNSRQLEQEESEQLKELL